MIPQYIYHTTLENIRKAIKNKDAYYTNKILSEIEWKVKEKYKNSSGWLVKQQQRKTLLAIYFKVVWM